MTFSRSLKCLAVACTIICSLLSTTHVSRAASPLPQTVEPLICRSPQRFQGPFTVGSTGAQFYLTQNVCSSGTYFQVQLYTTSAQLWYACDTHTANSNLNCSSGSSQCNPCYSPGQFDIPGSMYAYVSVAGTNASVGPI